MQERSDTDSTVDHAAPNRATPAPVTDAVRVQILATEHWSLLATRQLAWTETFSRATLFLTVLSAAVVALALVAQTGDEGEFTLFAVVLLPVVLLLGVATFIRLGAINEEDSRLVRGMNRLRRGYLDIAPDLEPYFVTGSHDDAAGLARTLDLDSTFRHGRPLQVLVSTPLIIGALDAVIAGVLCAVSAEAAGLSTGPAVGVGAIGGLVLLGLLAVLPARQLADRSSTAQPRFPD